MHCPHCGKEWEMTECPECGGATPPDSAYCCRCGADLGSAEEASDLTDRILCSDGACIGVINERGVCGVCGLPYTPEGSHE